MEIKEENATKAWKKALKYVLNEGHNYRDNDNRICREVLNLTIQVEKPEQDTLRPIEIINSLKKWIYPSNQEIESSILGRKIVPGYYYSYGQRAFDFKSDKEAVNQVDRFVIPLLKKDPTSRRAIIVFYNPLKDSLLYRKETPGMIFIDFKIRGKLLYVTTLIRSNDLFMGWPANIYQVHVLQKYVAEKLDCSTGPITIHSISAHIFEEHIEDIKKILETED
jgi:thymidylate synthase